MLAQVAKQLEEDKAKLAKQLEEDKAKASELKEVSQQMRVLLCY